MRFLPHILEGTKMRKILVLSLFAATPAFAHPANGGLHVPHADFMAALAIGVVTLAVVNYLRRR